MLTTCTYTCSEPKIKQTLPLHMMWTFLKTSCLSCSSDNLTASVKAVKYWRFHRIILNFGNTTNFLDCQKSTGHTSTRFVTPCAVSGHCNPMFVDRYFRAGNNFSSAFTCWQPRQMLYLESVFVYIAMVVRIGCWPMMFMRG